MKRVDSGWGHLMVILWPSCPGSDALRHPLLLLIRGRWARRRACAFLARCGWRHIVTAGPLSPSGVLVALPVPSLQPRQSQVASDLPKSSRPQAPTSGFGSCPGPAPGLCDNRHRHAFTPPWGPAQIFPHPAGTGSTGWCQPGPGPVLGDRAFGHYQGEGGLRKPQAAHLSGYPPSPKPDVFLDFQGGAVLRPVPDAELELSPEEQRVLERKLKKERKKEERQRLREAGLAAQHPLARRSGAELALDYLCAWAQKHENWRFQKTRQTWLLLHMYDRDKVPDEHFSTMLAYLEGLQGRARELTVQKAEALMRELDEEDPDPLLPGRVQRIRQVLQLLS
ncbi:hypothetical protein H8959_008344 [Pygathrix nigripes]